MKMKKETFQGLWLWLSNFCKPSQCLSFEQLDKGTWFLLRYMCKICKCHSLDLRWKFYSPATPIFQPIFSPSCCNLQHTILYHPILWWVSFSYSGILYPLLFSTSPKFIYLSSIPKTGDKRPSIVALTSSASLILP